MHEKLKKRKETVMSELDWKLGELLEQYFPEATSGDHSPDIWADYVNSLETFLDDWIEGNVTPRFDAFIKKRKKLQKQWNDKKICGMKYATDLIELEKKYNILETDRE